MCMVCLQLSIVQEFGISPIGRKVGGSHAKFLCAWTGGYLPIP
jgi:hypothetical protein